MSLERAIATVRRAPLGVKIAGAGVVALLLFLALSPARHGGKRTMNPAELQRALEAVDGLNLQKVKVVGWMLDEWRRDGRLSVDEQALLLAQGYKEGGFNLRAVSPDGAPDDAGGKAWGTFQFLKATLDGMGVKIGDVTPRLERDGRTISDAELERAARASARTAVKLLYNERPRWAKGRPYLEGVRTMHAGDPYKVAREVFTGWNTNVHKYTWADVAKVAPNPKPGSLGFVHYTVSGKLKALPLFRRALGLPAIRITTTV